MWQPYEAELGHLPTFCRRKGRMDGEGAACMFLASRETYTGPCCSSVRDGTRTPPYVDTDEALHAIDLRGKMEVNWRDRHYGHIRVWNT